MTQPTTILDRQIERGLAAEAENVALREEVDRLRGALRWIEEHEPATHELTLAHQMAQHAREALGIVYS